MIGFGNLHIGITKGTVTPYCFDYVSIPSFPTQKVMPIGLFFEHDVPLIKMRVAASIGISRTNAALSAYFGFSLVVAHVSVGSKQKFFGYCNDFGLKSIAFGWYSLILKELPLWILMSWCRPKYMAPHHLGSLSRSRLSRVVISGLSDEDYFQTKIMQALGADDDEYYVQTFGNTSVLSPKNIYEIKKQQLNWKKHLRMAQEFGHLLQ